ncbi:hypothetical protein GIB67_018899 [Kingdonia uniflora]|uniref:Mind bomb SH3 repeat domain-containing protein n=1 Tax=Kingdonia uniflora TaxID=39325 RepID=A0A7J7NRE4_9MAGN|nr:hypothetical protein GIB67_018899 [Kingdonia uniflora]
MERVEKQTNLEGATCEDGGGVVGAGTEKERTIVGEDAACCIYLAKYADNDKLRELLCTHFFHMQVGDWVRVKASVSSPKYGWEDITKSSIGIIHSLEEDGDMGVAFYFRRKPFCCSMTDMEKVPPFEVGQGIHMAQSVVQPWLGWLFETPATIGKITRIDMDGTLNVSMLFAISYFFLCGMCLSMSNIIFLVPKMISFKASLTLEELSSSKPHNFE